MRGSSAFSQIVHRSEAVGRVIRLAEKVAPTDAVVLITGESGTGKELFARAIHEASDRKDRPFVAMNCAAVPESLLESELFGHEKGSFTGATGKRKGKFEQAHTGTLFLDEIGDMQPSAQAKILRVLERIGGQDSVPIDIRVITATNQPLWERVNEGRFRRDLYYRLNEIHIDIPPLVDRKEDIPLIAEHFIARFNRQYGKSVKGLSDAAMSLLARHEWPGNVRELEHMIKHAILTNDSDTIWLEHLPIETRLKSNREDGQDPDAQAGAAVPLVPLEEIEKRHIRRILEHTGWNKSRAATILEISRPTLARKIRLYEVERHRRAAR